MQINGKKFYKQFNSLLEVEKIPPIVQTDQLLVESENVPTAVLHYISVLHQLFEKLFLALLLTTFYNKKLLLWPSI